MEVAGYARISQEEEDATSIQEQKRIIEDYCKDEELEVFNIYVDRNVSGATHPEERVGFSNLMEECIEERGIDTIIVKQSNRLARGRSLADIKEFLRGRYGEEIAVILAQPGGIEEAIDEMKESEKPTQRQLGSLMEDIQKGQEGMVVAQAKEKGKLLAKRKKSNDEPFGRPPYGITTDKQKHDKNVSREFLPDDKEEDKFKKAIAVLNEYAHAGCTPHDYDGDMSPYSVGKDKGMNMSNPTTTVKNIWDKKEIYREVAEKHRSDLAILF